MTNEWKPLLELAQEDGLGRGRLLKFPASYPFESSVVLMLCENRIFLEEMPFNLVALTGHKAGINPYQNLPKQCLEENSVLGFDNEWLKRNWNEWVYPDCDVKDVLVMVGKLRADELYSGQTLVTSSLHIMDLLINDTWKPLLDLTQEDIINRGSLFQFPASYPFESSVVQMLCENHLYCEKMPYNLVTITGHKAAINPFQNLPLDCLVKDNGVLRFDNEWLKRNWNKWVYEDCDAKDVLVRTAPLRADEL